MENKVANKFNHLYENTIWEHLLSTMSQIEIDNLNDLIEKKLNEAYPDEAVKSPFDTWDDYVAARDKILSELGIQVIWSK